MITERHIQAAIIGMWRQGARLDEITLITNRTMFYVSRVIAEYFKNEKLW